MLLLLLLQLINYMNDKFQKYKDVLSPQQDKIRLKRKVNETNENIRGLLSPRWPENRPNKTLHTTINRGQEGNKILHNFTRSHSIGRYASCYTLYPLTSSCFLLNRKQNKIELQREPSCWWREACNRQSGVI